MPFLVNAPLRIFRGCLLPGLLLLFLQLTQTAPAATWMALNTPSFYTVDIVFENDADPAVTNTFGARNFYEDSLRGNATYPGLNSSGLYSTNISGETVPFQLQPYTGNNLTKLGGSGTVTFDLTDGAYGLIALAIAAGNVGAGNQAGMSYTLNYTDLTSTSGVLIVPDWGNPAGPGFVEVFNVGRAAAGPVFENNNNFSAFGTIIPADINKTLSSITFGRTTTFGEIGFFAFAAGVPEPSRALLMFGGLAAMLLRRRRMA